jgi:hypothetical protein
MAQQILSAIYACHRNKDTSALLPSHPFPRKKDGGIWVVQSARKPQEKRQGHFGAPRANALKPNPCKYRFCYPVTCIHYSIHNFSSDLPLFCYMFYSIHSYKFLFIAQDDTTEAEFFAYDDTARNIIRRNVTAVINQQRKDPGFPQFLTEVVSKKITFAIIITDDSFGEMRTRTYQVKSVLIDHEYQAHRLARQLTIDAPGSASTQTPSVPTSVLQIGHV